MDPNLLEPDDKMVYDGLLSSDPDAAAEFLKTSLEEYKRFQTVQPSSEPVEVDPGTEPVRVIPGITGGKTGRKPGQEVPKPPSMEARDEQIRQNMFEFLESPAIFLDEAEQNAYNAAKKRFASEGYPDEEKLKQGIEQDYIRQIGFTPSFGSAEYGPMIIETEKRLQNLLKGRETAQAKAKELVFGLRRPRQARTTDAYDPSISVFEPRRKAMAQMSQEELEKTAKETPFLELAAEALGPQVVKPQAQVEEETRRAYEFRINNLANIDELQKQQPQNNREEAAFEYFRGLELEMLEKVLYPYGRFEMAPASPEEEEDAKYGTRQALHKIMENVLSSNDEDKELLEVLKDVRLPMPDTAQGRKAFERLVEDKATLGMELGGEALQYAMQSNRGFRKDMEQTGIAGPDAEIVESVPMMLLRDLNLLARAVINPTLAQAENITAGLIGFGREGKKQEELRKRLKAEGQEGLGLEQALGAKRVELTEELPYLGNPIDLGNAFLREILVETATMRGLGNDVAELEFMGEPVVGNYLWTGQTARDVLVGLGTLGELFVPLVPSKGKAITPFGKIGSKMPTTGGEAFKQLLFDAARTQSVLAVAPLAIKGIKQTGRNIPIIMKAAKDLEKLGSLGAAGALAGKLPVDKLKSIAMETSTVRDVVATDVAQRIQALRMRAGGLDDARIEQAVSNGIIDREMADSVKQLSPDKAGEVLESLAKADAAYASDAARFALEAPGTKGLDSMDFKIELSNVIKENTLLDDIGDTVLLTDRTIISSDKVDEVLAKAKDVLYEGPGDSRSLIFKESGGGLELINDTPTRKLLAGVARRLDDRYLAAIVNDIKTGRRLTGFEASYITNRVIDDIAIQSGQGIKPIKAQTLQEAAEPLERRGNIVPVPFAGELITDLTPPFVVRSIKDFYKTTVLGKPPPKSLSSGNASMYRALTQYQEYAQRQSKVASNAFSNVSKQAQGFFPKPFRGLNPTVITVAKLQDKGLSLSEIAGMSKKQITDELASPGPINTIEFDRTQNAIEVFVGKKLSDDQIQFMTDMLGQNRGFEDVPEIAEKMVETFADLRTDVAKKGEINKAMMYSILEKDRIDALQKIMRQNLDGRIGIDFLERSKQASKLFAFGPNDAASPEKLMRLNNLVTKHIMEFGELPYETARTMIKQAGLEESLQSYIRQTSYPMPDEPITAAQAMPGVFAAAPQVRKRRSKTQIMEDLGIPERGKIKDAIDQIEAGAPPKDKRPTLKSAEENVREQDRMFGTNIDDLSPEERKQKIKAQYDFEMDNYRESIADYNNYIKFEKAKYKDAEGARINQYFDEVLEEQRKEAQLIQEERAQRQQYIASERQRIQDEKIRQQVIYNNDPAVAFMADVLGPDPINSARYKYAGAVVEDVDNLAELSKRFGYEKTKLGDIQIEGLDPQSQKFVSELVSAYEANDKVIQQNLLQLSKRGQGLGKDSLDFVNYTLNGMRRSFVQGQLGGKYVPNLPYQAENNLTAGLLAYITNPKYAGTTIVQSIVPFKAPLNDIAMMARTRGAERVKGTRYTFREMQDAMNRYNIGVSESGINLGDSFYRDLEHVSRGFQQLVEGTPGYGKGTPLTYAESFLRTFGRGLKDIAQEGPISTQMFKLTSPETSAFMRWADNNDRIFRQNIFVKAVQNGESFETAAKIARETTLDYGKMPLWMRQGYAKAFLYLSFQALTGMEIAKALTTADGAVRIAAMTNFSRQLARRAGVWMYDGDKALENIFITKGDTDGSAEARLRNPWTGQLIRMGNFIDWTAGIATGKKPFDFRQTADGLLNQLYNPMLDYYKQLDFEYKKGVPPKDLFRIVKPRGESGKNPITFLQNPGAYLGYIQQQEGLTPYLFDRYDIEEVKADKRVPGRPDISGRQYRFRSKGGYQKFLMDQRIMATIGLKRGFSDYIEAARQAGLIETPENFNFTYYGPNQQPGFADGLDYLLLRKRPIRIPKEYEQRYRRLKAIERELIEIEKRFEK